MADVITRFKLETTQYDSKLRDAAKGIREISHLAEIAGNDFKGFSQKSVEAAKALGTVASGATTTKDKVKDLVGAYNEAAKAYNNLTTEQQQSDFGKALSQSIGTLSERVKEAKSELYGLGDAVEQVKGKGGGLFGEGGLTGMLAVAGGNLLAQGISMLGSEMADTVKQSIDLAKAGEGVRLAFERLNKPGLLDNLKEATHGTVSEIELMKAAVKFDDFKLPVEELGTLLAFAQKKAKDTGQSVDYMVDSIVTGLGRKSLMILDNLGLSASQIKDKMKEGGDMTKAVAEIIKEQMTEAGEYVETAADRAARAAADAQNEMEKLGREAMPVAEEWASAWNEIKLGGMQLLNMVLTPLADSIRSIRELLSEPFEIKFKANIPNLADGPNIDDNGNYIKKPSNGNWAGYDAANGRYFDEIDSMPEITVTGNLKKKKKKKTGGSSTTDQTAKIINSFAKAMTSSAIGADDLKQSDAKDFLSPYQMMLPEIKKNILDIKDADLGGALAKVGNDKVIKEIQDMNTALAQQKAAMNLGAQAASNFGAALQGIEDPSAKAAGTVTQAIASIALGFAMASSNANTAGTGWGWLAWLAAGMSAMATTISTVHSLTGYAEGGEIKGNSYSGDNIAGLVDGKQLIGLNAGEIVLNQAQQANVAHGLQGAGGNLHLEGILQGENILIAANRTAKRKGYGEMMFWQGG